MADNLNVSSRARFFCHRCLAEFRGISQEYLCPFCHTGFIEQLETGSFEFEAMDGDYDDAMMSVSEDMRNLQDVMVVDGGFHMNNQPMLNDVALLLSGGQLHPTETGMATGPPITPSTTNATSTTSTTSTPGTDTTNTANTTTNAGNRRPTLMEELVWMIGGSRPPAGAVTAGAPFVLVGAPGDYVFGGEGLDAVVTQLLGQLEHTGPPPLPRERLASIPTEEVNEELAAANVACSVCWENFLLGETTSRLICEHVFHKSCIEPWLQLHATCPICRRSLLPDAPADASVDPANAPPPAPRVIIRRATIPHSNLLRRFPTQTITWDTLTSSSGSPASSVTAGGLWAPQSSTNTGSTSSTNLTEMQYNTDIDYD